MFFRLAKNCHRLNQRAYFDFTNSIYFFKIPKLWNFIKRGLRSKKETIIFNETNTKTFVDTWIDVLEFTTRRLFSLTSVPEPFHFYVMWVNKRMKHLYIRGIWEWLHQGMQTWIRMNSYTLDLGNKIGGYILYLSYLINFVSNKL